MNRIPMTQKSLRIVVVFLVTLLTVTDSASAITRTLAKGKSVTVRSTRCELAIESNTTAQIQIRCGARLSPGKTRRSSTRVVYLAPLRRATIKARSCFLGATVSSQTPVKQIRVRCSATAPTATPTATATNTATSSATPTATVTPTATNTPTPTASPNANALLASNQILAFNTDFPAAQLTPMAITGVNAGDTIVSIDRRPQNGMLYGLGYNATSNTVQLYQISSVSGVASAVGSTGEFVNADGTPVAIGSNANTQFGMDFNPTVDRVRIVNSDGQNFRINPNTGAFIDGDLGGGAGSVTGVNPDGSANGATTSVQEAAYTNNAPNAGLTTQYTLDATTDGLYIQTPPNLGTQTNFLALGEDIVQVRGFDIPRGVDVSASGSAVTSGSGFAVLEFASNSQQRFATIDLTDGSIDSSSEVPSATSDILGLALISSEGVPMIGLEAGGGSLVRFLSSAPQTTTSVSVSGVGAGELLVGIDFRPATGELFGFGVNPTTDTGTLYRLDPQTGAATAIGASGLIAFVDGSGNPVDFVGLPSKYGFNFNPVADRIRVVTETGLNFRLNPNNGSAVDGDLGGASGSVSGVNPDGAINGAVTNVQATSYTNSFAQVSGSTVTTQYTIDVTTDSLYIQNTPNSGTQTNPIAVLSGGSTLDFSSAMAFEIPPETRAEASNTPVTSGIAYAVLTVGFNNSLYQIDLATGEATNLGTVTEFSGLAVGQTAVR